MADEAFAPFVQQHGAPYCASPICCVVTAGVRMKSFAQLLAAAR